MRLSTSVLTALVLASASHASPAGARNLIADPGFEDPSPPNSSYAVYNPGQAIGPWKVVGTSGNVAFTNTNDVGYVHFQAHSGQGFVDLTGNCDCGAPSGIEQRVSTTPGKTYYLTFWGSNTYLDWAGAGTTSRVKVFVGPTKIFTSFNKGGKGLDSQVWKKFSASFVATGPESKIRFINGDPNRDIMNGIDDIRLTESPD
jgi:hypothetical protein